MLEMAFENISFDVNLEEMWLNIVKTKQIWLILNVEAEQTNGNRFIPDFYKPKISFGDRALHGLLKACGWSERIISWLPNYLAVCRAITAEDMQMDEDTIPEQDSN